MRSIFSLLVSAAMLAAGPLTTHASTSDVSALVKQLASPKQIEQMSATVELWSVDASALPIVEAMLKDENPKVRVAAVGAIRIIGDKSALPVLAELSNDPDPEVRESVAAATKQFEPPKKEPVYVVPVAVQSLIKNITDSATLSKMMKSRDSNERSAADWFLDGPADEKLFKAVVPLLKDSDRNVSSRAAGVLCRFKDGRSDTYLLDAWRNGNTFITEQGPCPLIDEYTARAPKLAIKMMKDKNPQRREEACEVLAAFVGPDTLAVLKSAARDKSGEVRRNAIAGLSKSLDPSVVPLLIAALRDPDDFVSQEAAFRLGMRRCREAVGPLIKVIADPQSSDETKKNSAFALWEIGDKKVIPALLKCLRHRSRELQMDASTALGKLGAKEAVKPLLEIVRNGHDDAKRDAVRALGEIGDASVCDQLMPLLTDSNPEMRQAAMCSLAQLKDKRMFDILVKTADECSPEDSLNAVDALGELGDVRAVPHIIPHLVESYLPRAHTVLRALVTLGDVSAVKPIMAAVTKGWAVHNCEADCGCELPDYSIAADALMQLDDAEGNQFLMKCLKEKNLSVINGAYPFFISQGVAGSEEALISALDSRSMARDYIQSGNAKLAQAGRRYLAENPDAQGFDSPFEPSNVPKWGSKKPVSRK